MNTNMISETFDFDVSEEFYSLGNGGQVLEEAAKSSSFFSPDETFGFEENSLLKDLCLPSDPPFWLTEQYDLAAADLTGEASFAALDTIDEGIDFNNASISTSPSSSVYSHDSCSLSPSPSEDLLLGSPIPAEATLPSNNNTSADVQSLFDLINLDQSSIASNESGSLVAASSNQEESNGVGPVRVEKSATKKASAAPYSKPTSSGRKPSVKTQEQKSRKKKQNRSAATRYRIKKKDEFGELFAEAGELEKKNAELKEKVGGLQTEIDYLKSLMLDVIKARLGKSSDAGEKQNSSILITNSRLIGAAS